MPRKDQEGRNQEKRDHGGTLKGKEAEARGKDQEGGNRKIQRWRLGWKPFRIISQIWVVPHWGSGFIAYVLVLPVL